MRVLGENRHIWIGVAFMVAGSALLPVGDAIAKMVMRRTAMEPEFLAWSRFALGAALFLPAALIIEGRPRLTRFFLISQTLRGALAGFSLLAMVTAVSLAPMAEVFGAFFIGPAISALAARFLLGEEVRAPEWAALALGLLGVFLVTRPGAEMSLGVVSGLIAGVLYGLALTTTRWSAGRVAPLTMLAMQLLVGLVLVAPLGVPSLLRTGLEAPWLVAAAAMTSALYNLTFIMAYRYARAGTLAPVVYLQIVSAAGLGWLLFGEAPDLTGAVGLAVILTSGAMLALVRR